MGSEERRNFAGQIEQATAVRSPIRTPNAPAGTTGIIGVPKRRRWNATDRANKVVSKENVVHLKKAHNALTGILATADPKDIEDAVAELEDGTDLRREKKHA